MPLRTMIPLLPTVLLLPVLALAAPAASATPGPAGPPHIPTLHFAQAPATPRTVTGTRSDTYVTTRGSDTGTCPRTAPCATITYAQTQTAIGGTIHLADGTYHQSANLTQPVHLAGADESRVIIDGTNIDYTAKGYYGLIAVNNTSGTAGTISISNVTVTHPYVTATEAGYDSFPIDIGNFDQQTGDTVDVDRVTFGGPTQQVSYPNFGYYSLNAVSTNVVKEDRASGMQLAYFAEGSGGPTTFVHDVARDLVGYTSGGTYQPPVGVYGLADTSANLPVTADDDYFVGYNGWGIVGEAGYSEGNCTANVCVGGLTLNTNHNCFDLKAAPAGLGVAAIAAYANLNDSLTAHVNNSYGRVANPDLTVSVVSQGGTVTVTDSDNTIRVTH